MWHLRTCSPHTPEDNPQRGPSGTNSKPVIERLIRYTCHRVPFGALLLRRRQLHFHRSHRGNPNIQRRTYAWEAQLRWGMASICRTTGIWAVDLALIRNIHPGANQSTTTLLSLKTKNIYSRTTTKVLLLLELSWRVGMGYMLTHPQPSLFQQPPQDQ